MSLGSLLDSKEYIHDRKRWHLNVSRHALNEYQNNSLTGAPAQPEEIRLLLVRKLLEGDLTPWKEGYDFEPSDGLETMRWIAAGGDDPETVFPALKEAQDKLELRCQEVWTGDHVAYRCRTCGISENSCMCVYCFDAADHPGHDYMLYRSGAGGCCDCGDPQAWRESGFCKKHSMKKNNEETLKENTIIYKSSKFACQVVCDHLLWCLRRCFYFDENSCETSGCYGMIRCFQFFTEMASVCHETMKAVCESFLEKRYSSFQFIGWGNYCPAFANDLVTDGTVNQALLRLCCNLPKSISFTLTQLFLKLLLNPDFKVVFTKDFVQFFSRYIHLLALTRPTINKNQVQENQVNQHVYESEDEEEGEDEQNISTQNASFLKKSLLASPNNLLEKKKKNPLKETIGIELTPNDFETNSRQFVDRIYCQLFHSETVCLEYANDVLLPVMLTKLESHLSQALMEEQGVDLDLHKTRKSLFQRLLHEVHLLLHHESICLQIFENEQLFSSFLNILKVLQLLDYQRRRESTEVHVERTSNKFQPAFILVFEVEEQITKPLVKTIKSILSSKYGTYKSLFQKRLMDTYQCLARWTSGMSLRLTADGWYSCHVPLTRFFFTFYELLLSHHHAENDLENDESMSFDTELLKKLSIPSLRALAMIWQIIENRWVRNGQIVINNSLWYLKFFSYSYLEVDLLACRVCCCLDKSIAASSSNTKSFFTICQEELGSENAIRLFGGLALQGNELNSTKRAALHFLATRNCSFSELEGQCPPKCTQELDEILKEIADFHDANPLMGNAHFSIKKTYWKDISFGRFYLRWFPYDEENALTRYRRAFNLKEDYYPIPNFTKNEFSEIILNNKQVFDTCFQLCSNTVVQDDGQQNSSTSSSSVYSNYVLFIDYCEANVNKQEDLVDEEELKRKAALKAQKKAMRLMAKKQKNFQLVDFLNEEEEESQYKNAAAVDTATAVAMDEMEANTPNSNNNTTELCSLCRKPGSMDECLSLLILTRPSSLLYNEESICIDGEGKCCAVSKELKCPPLPEMCSGQPESYAEPRSIFTCINTIRHYLQNDMDSSFSWKDAAHSSRTILHTCNHFAHESCLERYRESILLTRRSSQQHQFFESLKSNELSCPVCRRVTNGLLPLLPKMETTVADIIFVNKNDWLKSRLEEYNTNNVKVVVDPYSPFVERFQRNFEGETPENLILTQLHAAESSSSVKSILSPLLNLFTRQPHSFHASNNSEEEEDDHPYFNAWTKFVLERFGENRKIMKRSSCLNSDLSLVFIQWLILCPSLRLASMEALIEEGKRVLSFLLEFARLQDVIMKCIFSQKGEMDERELKEERGCGKNSDALRSAAVHQIFNELSPSTTFPPHRLSPKDRNQLETQVDQLLYHLFQAPHNNTELLIEQSCKSIIRDFFPRDCFPFTPLGGNCQESAVDRLTRHASLLGISLPLKEDNDQEEEGIMKRKYIRIGLLNFFKEILEQISSVDRPIGVQITTNRLLVSSLLPNMYPKEDVTTLVRLPQDYGMLTIAYLARSAICNKCDTCPETPAICLSCGTLLCHDACCREENGSDEISSHGIKCSRGIGDFRYFVWGSLYLDAHNEEDRNLARGKPLKLSQERLSTISKLHKSQAWLQETKIIELL